MNSQPLVLVADDEPRILKLVTVTLAEEGYRVVTASSGEEAVRKAEEIRPDLVLLDIVMPDLDGIEVMRQLREWRFVPVILLTAKGATADKARGLNLGADDYVAKPFNPDELAGRVRAVLRRAAGITSLTGTLRIGRADVDLERRVLVRDGVPVELSRTEWMLLQHLAANAGKVVLHNELLTTVWGPEYRDDLDYLRVWVSRVRRKLGAGPGEAGPITTFQGIGYVLEIDAPGARDAAPSPEAAAVPEPVGNATAGDADDGPGGVLVTLDAVLHLQGSEPRVQPGARPALERLRSLGPVAILAPGALDGRSLPRERSARVRWVRRLLDAPELPVTDWLAPATDHGAADDAAAAWRELRSGHGHPKWLITVDNGSTAAARRAGLGVIRVGPRASGPVAEIARPDYAARDLRDAVNHLLTRSTFAEPPAATG